uniref:Uncharacterized protein n=1 Tax=Oryza sativa subsp. japonica TaxID=39947 RepID=Q6H5P2_ORYSJ|nr:hypothetical protein [Oryza sativa Japonica Group]
MHALSICKKKQIKKIGRKKNLPASSMLQFWTALIVILIVARAWIDAVAARTHRLANARRITAPLFGHQRFAQPIARGQPYRRHQ